jgi:hypothetical protein
MSEPFSQQSDDTRASGADKTNAAGEHGVLGGDAADRMDSPGPGSGGLPGGGADGETAAREQLRKDLGERSDSLGSEEGGGLEQGAATGETDDPQGGSIQQSGSRP